MPTGVYERNPAYYCEYSKRGGDCCKGLKCKGSTYCRKHRDYFNDLDKNRSKISSTRNPFDINLRISSQLLASKNIPSDRMKFYGKQLGPKLSQLIQDSVEESNAHDISKEVAVVKAISSQSVGIYDSIMELPDGAVPNATRTQLLHDAGQVAISALDQATRMVERSAKIFALTTERVDPLAVDKVAKQICRFVYICFEDFETELPEDADEETVKQFVEFDEAVRKVMLDRIRKFDTMVAEELQLPTLKQLGTTITPDQQIMAMIDSVPFTESA